MMNWEVPRIWEGGEVWIIGGGPSVTKQFDIPDNIVRDVKSGISSPSVYSPYMVAIHNKHVIGINVAYLIGEWIDMVFFGDNKFFLPHMEKLAKWPGLKVTCHSGSQNYNWVKFLAHDTSHPRGISPDSKKVSWNANSGSAAISVAANAGAKRIILLGFDMTLNGSGDQHWHKLYRGEPTAVRSRRRPPPAKLPAFGKHMMGFPIIAKDARTRGIEIINASPDSIIKEFPKMTVKEILNGSIHN
jgi:hypothetical protein